MAGGNCVSVLAPDSGSPAASNPRQTKFITKSCLLAGLICQKRLWLQTFEPELGQEFPTSKLAIEAGIEVDNVARLKYPDGIPLGHGEHPLQAVKETAQLIDRARPVPLFGASFLDGDVLVRTDIIAPTDGGWRIIEVKSSGSVKDHHLSDCAIQLHVLENAGIQVNEVCLGHVDTSYEYAGAGNYQGLIREENVTERVKALLPDVPTWITAHQDVLSHSMPRVRMGSHCKNTACQFLEI